MRQIVDDWVSYCKGENIYPDSHFYILFMDLPTDEEIEAIYQFFPNKEELISRMKDWINYRIVGRNQISEKAAKELLVKDLAQRSYILEKLHAGISNLGNIKYKFKDYKVVEKELFNDELSQNFLDYISSNYKYNSDKRHDNFDDNILYELSNAIYGVTSDYDIQFYLYQPLLKIDYTAEYLYEFITGGGIYAFTEEGISYSIKSGMRQS